MGGMGTARRPGWVLRRWTSWRRRANHDAGRGQTIGDRPAQTFNHILVPLDLGSTNDRVISLAIELAVASRARVTLLHVIQRVAGISVAEMRAFYDKLEARASRYLTRVARDFAARDLTVRAVILIGNPAREIVRYAADKHMDLIMIGSHAVESPTSPTHGLGTTSYKTAIACRCPVLLVK